MSQIMAHSYQCWDFGSRVDQASVVRRYVQRYGTSAGRVEGRPGRRERCSVCGG